MASLRSIQLLTKSIGNIRSSISRLCIKGITAHQLTKRTYHCIRQSTTSFVPQLKITQVCSHSTEEDMLRRQENEKRVMKVIAAFDRISSDKLTLESHFLEDLGLDSLDHVEIIMAIEDEFGFEIPDMDAEKLMRPRDIVTYVGDRLDIYA